jgi:hypothetical protein
VSRKEHHIVPNRVGGWSIKKSGGEKAIKNFDRKSDAEDFGRVISQNQGSELIIHGKDGKVQRSDSHGNDPNPPKDSG